ncbi:G protein-coupled receptor 89 [Coprinopsis sp. MPI-PUGE-AT-0042]|nr:G protein-coupled receptor 89 [Coprinopsis sp. MPI-PUGE-AT-0042]
MASSWFSAENLFLILTRLVLLLGCRKYLLRVVYSNLKTISGSDKDRENVELDVLPTPSTHTPKTSRFAADSGTLHSLISSTVFSWAFAECCMMFILLVLQGMNVFSSSARLLHWQFSLFSLVAIVLAVIPLCISLILSLGNADKLSLRSCCGPRGLAYFIPVLVYLLALSYIPLPSGMRTADLSHNILSRLIVLGTVILGILSGFGAIRNSWGHLPYVSRKVSVPTEAQIQAAEYTLTSTRNDLHQRRQREQTAHGESPQGSWLSRVGTTLRGGDSLSQEIRGLESLEHEMTKQLELLRYRRDSAVYSSTWVGKVWDIAGRLFAIYCITRIFSCLYNITFLPSQRSVSNVNYSDLLSNALAYGVSHLSSASIKSEDIASFSRQLSLALVGLIILTSIRYVLRGVSRLLRVSSRSLGASLMLLFLAQIMSIYLLSTVVQMRASFPPPTAGDDSSNDPVVNLFSTIPEYELFGSLFDWAFLLTAAASAALRWGAEKVSSVGDD